MAGLTPRETEIMTVLWERGPSTVAEVRDALDDGTAYTTVLTLLRILEEKGHATRSMDGRAHRYQAVTAPRAARQSALRRLVRQFFRGSPELLLTQLVSETDLPRDTLERLRGTLDERLSAPENGGEDRDTHRESRSPRDRQEDR